MDSGVKSLTMSAPVLRADMEAMIGAPKYGPPATIISLPFCPLWLHFPGTGYLSMSPGPVASTASAGMPMSAMMISPLFSRVIPSLMSWNVTVATGRTDMSVPSPDGMSTDTTVPESDDAAMKLLYGSLTSPLAPVAEVGLGVVDDGASQFGVEVPRRIGVDLGRLL